MSRNGKISNSKNIDFLGNKVAVELKWPTGDGGEVDIAL